MTTKTQTRKLAAIVSIDVAGYSALVERDAAAAAGQIAVLHQRAEAAAAAHGGRVFSSAGDGLMLEFATASSALSAAIALGEADPEPPLRFGVHLGEVMVAGNGDLLGHGVNIAARLQAEATPGGMLVSQIVRDMLEPKLAKRLAARGRVRLEKMRETMNVFALTLHEGLASADPGASDPVLAVLPFDNLSRDQDTRFFSDGVSEEILYSVSRVKGLKVIGSTSSFAFRGRDKPKAARALSATHVLDGSVRRHGDNVRIAAQLTEAESGVVLWSERYDREIADAFALQEEIAGEVAGALTLALGAAQRTRAPKITAAIFDSYLMAREHLRAGAPGRVQRAMDLLNDIVSESPDFARAWSSLASARLECMRLARTGRAALAAGAREAAQRAIGLDQEIGEAYADLAALIEEFGHAGERERLLERALEAEPNNAFLLLRHGQFLVSIGRVADGYARQAEAYHLDPLDPLLAAFHGHNLWATGAKDEGRRILDEAAQRFPDNMVVWYMRLNTSALDGDFAKADALRAEGARLLPEHKDSHIMKSGEMLQAMLADPTPENFVKLGEDFTAMADAQPSAALDLAVALAVLGLTQPALAIFEEALENIDAWRQDAPDAIRPHVGYETALLFIQETIALRMDPGFARLCAKVGLVDYWTATDRWPDCVAETAPAYDFQAACKEARAA